LEKYPNVEKWWKRSQATMKGFQKYTQKAIEDTSAAMKAIAAAAEQ
jgi:hypothetical protein